MMKLTHYMYVFELMFKFIRKVTFLEVEFLVDNYVHFTFDTYYWIPPSKVKPLHLCSHQKYNRVPISLY